MKSFTVLILSLLGAAAAAVYCFESLSASSFSLVGALAAPFRFDE